jgi:hypothetical protein
MAGEDGGGVNTLSSGRESQMASKPIIGLAGLFLAGAALAGCQPSNRDNLIRGGGQPVTNGAAPAAQNRSWDTRAPGNTNPPQSVTASGTGDNKFGSFPLPGVNPTAAPSTPAAANDGWGKPDTTTAMGGPAKANSPSVTGSTGPMDPSSPTRPQLKPIQDSARTPIVPPPPPGDLSSSTSKFPTTDHEGSKPLAPVSFNDTLRNPGGSDTLPVQPPPAGAKAETEPAKVLPPPAPVAPPPGSSPSGLGTKGDTTAGPPVPPEPVSETWSTYNKKPGLSSMTQPPQGETPAQDDQSPAPLKRETQYHPPSPN